MIYVSALKISSVQQEGRSTLVFADNEGWSVDNSAEEVMKAVEETVAAIYPIRTPEVIRHPYRERRPRCQPRAPERAGG